MSSISTTINNGIELGIAYASPLTITASGFVNAGTSGYHGAAVYAAAAAVLALVNQGRISIAGTGVAVFEGTDQRLTLNNSGTIGAVADAVYLQHYGPITNSGTILSTAAIAINDSSALQVTNATGDLISGYGVAIKAPAAGVTNDGTIRGTSTHSIAIYLNGGASSTVDNTGLIAASYNALEIVGAANVSNSSAGTISATANWGIRINGAATITNDGTISGGANAIHLFSDSTVVNTGHIAGADAIIAAGALSLANAGTIAGTYGTGIVLGSGTVSNSASGLISSVGYTAVTISGGAGTVTNAGTITGYAGVAFYAAGTASQTLIDSGTIIGSGGAAISFGAGIDCADGEVHQVQAGAGQRACAGS